MSKAVPIKIMLEADFKSPRSRKWYFATQNPNEPGAPVGEKHNRWGDIIEAARDATRVQPGITGEELIGAVNNNLDVTLTPSEEDRVRKLVETGRQQSFVGAPEHVPKKERTPEILEILEQEWSRIEEEKKIKKERAKEKAKPAPTSVDLNVPAVGAPGMYMFGGKNMKDSKKYFLDEYPCIADADHWRAFQQAVQLLRSYVEDSDVKEEIAEEYPEVDVEEILKAAKGFAKEGSKDPYVIGREAAEQLASEAINKPVIVARYADMVWKQVNPIYLKGFKDGLPNDILRLVNNV